MYHDYKHQYVEAHFVRNQEKSYFFCQVVLYEMASMPYRSRVNQHPPDRLKRSCCGDACEGIV